jgi:hypothetical protein
MYKQYRISEWAEFQVWKFLHLLKLAHGKKNLPSKAHRPAESKAFLLTGLFSGEISIPETHSPFGVNQVMKGIEISQWPSHIIQE